MAKIILSRKGFDSEYGRKPSPILPDGTMLSFPIPANSEETVSSQYGKLRYDDLPYLELMKQLGIKGIEEVTKAHLDPDINFYVTERCTKNWKAIFGQSGKSASGHLHKQKVGKGDIFLFFGWFGETILTEQGYMYDPSDKNGKHVLWGYMEVGEVIKIEEYMEYPDYCLSHPHFEHRNQLFNTAYIATERLSFNSNLSGAGVFKFNEELVLSCDPKRRTIWKLPKFFHPDNGVKVSFNPNPENWTKMNDCCILDSADKGQEFVCTENPDIENWAKNIILNNINEKFQHV